MSSICRFCFKSWHQTKDFRHTHLQHFRILLLGESFDASGKSSIAMYFKRHISSKKIRLENYISKNFPKIYYLLNWKINKRNIWVEIYSWLLKNKVVLQETKNGLIIYPKSESEIMEKRLKYYDSFL